MGPSVSDPAPRARFAGWLGRALPTALALAGLGGLAYWGVATDWNFGMSRPAHDRARADEAATVRFRDGATSATVTYPSEAAVERAGIDVAPVWKAAMAEAIAASGELSFDPRATARLSSRAAGVAHRIDKAVGDTVQADDLLALIDAAEAGRAKAEFQQALVQVRLKHRALAVTQGSALPEQRRREAEAALRDAEVRLGAAEQALVNLGLPVRAADYENAPLPDVVRRMRGLGVPGDPTTANLLPVRAPFACVVLQCNVVTGEVVEAGKVLFVVVDPRRLWLTLHVPMAEARQVQVGHDVLFRPDGATGEVAGKVAWIGTSADETTRTVPVRVELANDDGRLRASTLGQGRIVLRTAPEAIVVPPDAVHSLGEAKVVFVRDLDYLKPGGPKAFHARAVRTGAADAANVEIRDGLKLGEVVAVKGGRAILGEIQKGGAPAAKGRTP